MRRKFRRKIKIFFKTFIEKKASWSLILARSFASEQNLQRQYWSHPRHRNDYSHNDVSRSISSSSLH
jgi:hypothetical protein